MNIDFSNKNVIITGGTRGIGESIAKLFLTCNANVIATGTNKNKIDLLNDESANHRLTYEYLDYSSKSSITQFVKFVNQLDSVDVLINNAGINKIDSIDKIDEDDWANINQTNLEGPFKLTKEVSKIMISQNYGRIVNISSIFGVISKKKRAVYSTTKWGLIGFTKAVALDLAEKNILTNSVAPGFVDTELTRNILSKEELEKLKSDIPQKRLASAEEIAKVVLFLSSNHNSYITGQNIIIDGGFTSA